MLKNRQGRARAMLMASVVIFGTLAPFVRNISISSGELALCRAAMASVLILAGFLLTGRRVSFGGNRRDGLLLLLSGAAMGVNWILLFEAYRYTTVSVATLSYYFAPVLVAAVCPVLFHERPTAKQVLCFVMSTAGLVLVIGVADLGGGSSDLVGIGFGLGAAVFYACVILLNKMIRGVAGLQRTFLQFAAALTVLLPYVLATGGIDFSRMDGTGWGCLLVVGVVHSGLAYCLYFSALKELPGQEAALLSYADPLVAVLVSVLILGEPMTWMQLVGGSMILGFTIWNEWD